MTQTYKHSGKFAPLGIVSGIVAGLVAGLPLAYVYAWGSIKIDEQKLACFATIAYGALVGAAVAMGLKWGKVRNSIIGGVTAVLPAAVSLYWSWAFWAKNIFLIFAQKELDPFMLMARPQALWDLIKLINQYGTWGMSKGDVTKGTALWVIWGLEASVVLGTAALAAVLVLEMKPFCENCKLWCSLAEKLYLSPGDPSQITQSLAKRDFNFLQKLGPGTTKTGNFMTAQLHSCANCGELNTLTLQQTTTVRTSKWRKPTITTVSLTKKLLLSREEADTFRNTAHNVKQFAKAARA